MTFARPTYQRQPLPPPVPLARPVNAPRCDGAGMAQPKGEAAKPGKRAPTAVERAWMDWIVSVGCIACRLDGMPPRPTAVHHILRGGVRMGHMHTLPLCQPGHHMDGAPLGLISRHPWKQQFEQRYGTELQLLEILRKENAALDSRALSAIKPGAL